MNARSILPLLILLGALLRLIAIDLRPAGTPLYAPDEPDYVEITTNLWLGDGYMLGGQPTAYRDMLFPVLAAGIFKLTGGSIKAVQYFQLILSLLTGWLLYIIGRKRVSEKWALVLCGIWMVYPLAVIYPSLFVTETLFMFLLMLCFVWYDKLEARRSVVNMLLLGVLLGLLCLSRAPGTFMVLSVLIYVVLIRYELPWRERFRTAALVLTACLVVVLPWMIRNYVVVDSFSLNTNGGMNMFIGNNPEARGSYYLNDEMLKRTDSLAPTEAGRDRACRTLASEYFWGNFRHSLELWPKKFAHFWSTDMAMLTHYLPLRGSTSLAESLRAQPAWALLVMAIPYCLIVMIGTAGFYLVKHFPTRGLFILYIFWTVFAAFVTYGLPRYHYPVMPAMMLGMVVYLERKPWGEALPWRRNFLLMVLGLFGGIWLFEVATITGFYSIR